MFALYIYLFYIYFMKTEQSLIANSVVISLDRYESLKKSQDLLLGINPKNPYMMIESFDYGHSCSTILLFNPDETLIKLSDINSQLSDECQKLKIEISSLQYELNLLKKPDTQAKHDYSNHEKISIWNRLFS